MQPIRYFQEGGEADYGFYDPYFGDMYDSESYDDYEPLSQEEYDQQEAEYYGLTVDELQNYRQQQAGIGALPAAQETAGDAPYVASATTSTTSRW